MRGILVFAILPQHVERTNENGLAIHRNLETAPQEAQPGLFKVPGRQHPCRIDFDPNHRYIPAHCPQPGEELDGRDWTSSVTQIDHQRVRRRSKTPGLRPGEPAIQPAQPVGIGGAAGDASGHFPGRDRFMPHR